MPEAAVGDGGKAVDCKGPEKPAADIVVVPSPGSNLSRQVVLPRPMDKETLSNSDMDLYSVPTQQSFSNISYSFTLDVWMAPR